MEDENFKKKAAFAGQWRTPPLPVFATSTASNGAAAGRAGSATGNHADVRAPVPGIPTNPEDYARALQEAYRKGAEDAANLVAKQQLSNAVSCPDFTQSATDIDEDTFFLKDDGRPTEPDVPNPLLANDAIDESMPPPLPLGSKMAQPDEVQSSFASHAISSSAVAASLSHVQQRSISLPDMASYAAQQEEEKRQKRLARNRASARIRRLRKKNLVDAYEAEVGILERTLEQLRQHEWGAQDNASALTEALSMDRGQQTLTLEQRKETTIGILKQQLEFVEMLEELMAEQYVLHHLRETEEFNDLNEALQLTDEQYEQLEAAKAGWEEEWAALQTVKTSLVTLRDNNWLWNENVNQITEQFMSILHKNQVSKFLLWTDHNSEAIDDLDIVHAAPTTAEGPVFHFGAENHPESIVDDEK